MGLYLGSTDIEGASFYLGSNAVTGLYLGSNNLLPSSWVTDSLLGYWDANNATSYGGSGTTWTDLSGNSKNLTHQSSPSYTGATGGDPGYFAIDSVASSTDYFSITDDTLAQLNNNTGLTIHALVYITDFSALRYIVGSNSTANGAWRVKAQNISGNKFAYQPWDSVGNAFNVLSVGGQSPTTWYFVTLTHDWATATGEVSVDDGSMNSTGTSTNTPSFTGGTMTVGNAPATGDAFKGRISAVMVYNKVLSSGEITQNYNYVTGQY